MKTKTSGFVIALALLLAPTVVRAQSGDPANGKFTLDEATAGLTGTGPLMATIETTQGTITCELFADKAPTTVANFVGLARGTRPWLDPKTHEWVKGKPFYDGLTFHRVIPGFMIQGGDPLGTGIGNPGYKFDDEISDLKFDKKGQLAMANAGTHDGKGTNGSQFFVTDSTPSYLNGKHTIFGQCEPQSVVGAITSVSRGAQDWPTEPVVMKKVTIAYKNAGKAGKKPGGAKAKGKAAQ